MSVKVRSFGTGAEAAPQKRPFMGIKRMKGGLGEQESQPLNGKSTFVRIGNRSPSIDWPLKHFRHYEVVERRKWNKRRERWSNGRPVDL